MKISEVVNEAKGKEKLRKATTNSLPNVHSYPYLDNANHPYTAYRFGVALAKSPNDVDHLEGPIGTEFTTIGYSDADQEIIDHTRKEFGLPARKHSAKGSVESDTVGKVSPVAKPKRNKYGV
jgi:hypothetical protein